MARKRRKTKADNRSDISGIVLITIGIIIIFSVFASKSGLLIDFIKKILYSLLGVGIYVVPVFFIFLGTCHILRRGKISYNKKFYGIAVFFIITLLFIQMLDMPYYYFPDSIMKGINKLYESQGQLHGGIVSFLIVIPLYKLLGAPICYVIFAASYIISLILVFDISISDILLSIRFRHNDDEKVTEDKPTKKYAEKNIDQDIENKDNFLTNLNKKIKIIDFIKNSNYEETSEAAPDIVTPVITQEKEKSKIKDAEVNEQINKELTEKIIMNNNLNPVEYKFPSSNLLNQNSLLKLNRDDKKDLLNNATKLEETLGSFGVDAKVIQVTKGPSVTRFELQPSSGVKVSKIVNLSDDIALSLAARGVRIEAPIPGKSAVGIEVPNKELSPVFLREVIDSEEFISSTKNLAFCLGKDIGGKCVVSDLTKMPHMLIAGATGSGKSVCINTLIISILFKYSPENVKLLMIDPKVVELNVYNGIPHLLIPVVTEPKKAAGALNWAVNEMTRRYKLFAENGVRNIEGFNELFNKGKISEKLPLIVIIVDELADLMMVCPNDIEDYIGRLAQMARAAGMHLVIATQRPSVDVITGVIKANIPSRISFAVSSQIDSRTILDCSGAEKLLGKGDMLFYPVGESKPLRIQGAFISEEEVEKVVDFIKSQQTDTEYKVEILEQINTAASSDNSDDDRDELLDESIRIVVESGQASTSLLQRRLRVGYNRAARIMEQLELNGIISEKDGSKPRQILVDKRDYLENIPETDEDF